MKAFNLKSGITSALLVTATMGAYSSNLMAADNGFIDASLVQDREYLDAGMKASNVINEQRQTCGLTTMADDRELVSISSKHAKYLQYLHTNMALAGTDDHYQVRVKGYENVTGSGNPHFTGFSFTDRVIAANYQNAVNGGSENLIQQELQIVNGKLPSPNMVAEGFVRGLLSAPYHMETLLAPEKSLVGSSVVAYRPKGTDPKLRKGFILVNSTSITKESSKQSINGLFTYPCDGVKGTVTALYNEYPSPVEGTGRNLRKDPIGQPIFVYMPSAKEIKVSNIKIFDKSRNQTLPTQLLDHTKDPHKNTEYQLQRNKAFIMPITDSLHSCYTGAWQNCGLHRNTEYQVSFDVLVDNKSTIKKSFKFTTGKTNR